MNLVGLFSCQPQETREEDALRRVEDGSSATPGVARTCTREQPIEDI